MYPGSEKPNLKINGGPPPPGQVSPTCPASSLSTSPHHLLAPPGTGVTSCGPGCFQGRGSSPSGPFLPSIPPSIHPSTPAAGWLHTGLSQHGRTAAQMSTNCPLKWLGDRQRPTGFSENGVCSICCVGPLPRLQELEARREDTGLGGYTNCSLLWGPASCLSCWPLGPSMGVELA